MSSDDVSARLPSVICMPKVVRDLLWTVTSPHLLSGDRFPVLPPEFGLEALKFDVVIDWLNGLVTDPTPLLVFLQETTSNGRSLALGVYFSTLLEYWLRFCPHLGMEKMEIGKQIVSSTNRTVGQLKFLFRCNFASTQEARDQHRDFHVESSVKFFLLNPVDNGRNGFLIDSSSEDDRSMERNSHVPLEQFVGPHLGENLAWRVQEVERKLAMCRGESVRAWLEENYSDNVQSHIVLRGYLFKPLHHFESTSQTTVAHDWCFHRNPAKGVGMDMSSNPSIATDHLRGWWTTAMETDLPAKVRANAQQGFGESRFVILPNLQWLSPVVAVESTQSGQIYVEGDNRLDIPEVGALTLDELMAFVREHFQKVASAAEANKTGGVAMPLLVAEIVRCFNTLAVVSENGHQHWYELSRGFILDPKCWDPSPLCSEPVRFRRTLRRNIATGLDEREYEVRRLGCADEGFIKPDADEITAQDEQKRHEFVEPATVGPEDLSKELVLVLGAENTKFSHAELKRSTKELLMWRRQHPAECASNGNDADESAYLRSCLETLIGRANGEEEPKLARRVGYLLLDVLDNLNRESRLNDSDVASSQECVAWVTLLASVVNDPERWEFLNLVLRAIDLTLRADPFRNTSESSSFSFLDKLVAARSPRWNAIVVEAIRVFRIGELAPGHKVQVKSTEDAQKVKLIFADFVQQCDWQSAERLVTLVQDPVMMQTLFKHLSLLNMTKALKRLQKIAAGIHNSTEFTLQAAAHSDSTDEISSHLLGSPVDHAMNRSLNKNRPHELKWKYIDSLEEIEEVIQHLQKCEATLHSEDVSDEQRVAWNALVGIDYTVYVIDVQVLGKAAAAPLNFIWKSASRLLLIGFCVASDIQRIRNSFPDLGSLFDRRKEETLRRPLLLELKELALFRHVPAKNWGLSKLYRACLGEQVDKEQQCSDWGSRPLSNVQLAYAAKDAYAVQRLALHFLADVSFARARGEGGSVSDSILDYMKGFDACRNFSYSWTVASASHPLGKQHVKAALQALGVQARFLRCDESENAGLLVKSIALLVRKGKQTNAPRRILHAVAVLPLDRSIDMQALGSLLGADPDDVSLADQETLVRVFGYSRGCLGPIGLREQSAMRIIVDDCVKSEDYLLCGAGEADEVYAIAPEVLIKTVDAVVAKNSS
ncbi:hypothetical protein PR002_g24016 [Phytophthora rubi]|uniref:3'-5' exonuclease domain-containing protein n=2 Tax=Phytophthora rubi TaxID=129364 RepID=A0A6A3ICJ3_9STRA|nr:hypothetical protein PR002_g24016 [Phytophthora rubi]